MLQYVCGRFDWPGGEAWLPLDAGLHFARAAGFGCQPQDAGDAVLPSIDAGALVARAALSGRSEWAAGHGSGSGGSAVVIPVLDGEEVVCALVFVLARARAAADELGAGVIGAAAPKLGAFFRRKLTAESRLLSISEELQLRSELLDLAHDAVVVFEPGGHRISYWNRGAQTLYGYSAEEACGQITEKLLATAFPESREAIDEALAREGQWVGELRHTRKDGAVIVVSSRQALHRDPEGRPIAVIELNSDVTAQRRAEESNRRLAVVVQSRTTPCWSPMLRGSSLSGIAVRGSCTGIRRRRRSGSR